FNIINTETMSNPTRHETYPISLHDALPICDDPREMLAWSILAANCSRVRAGVTLAPGGALDDGLFDVLEVIVRRPDQWLADDDLDRKSTRLNSSHVSISYAVFCLNKKKKLKKAFVVMGNQLYYHANGVELSEQRETLFASQIS